MKTESPLYEALKAVLRKSKEPLTCNALFEMSAIAEHAPSANRVSDYLGGLWRKGLVLREPVSPTSGDASRWAYTWNKSLQPPARRAAVHVDQIDPQGDLDVEITKHKDGVTIDLGKMTITIKLKQT